VGENTKTKSAHHLPLVAIAAGASGLVLLALALVALLIILRRRRKAKGHKLADTTPTSNPNPQSIIKAELDASPPDQKHEVDANPDLKYPSEMCGHDNEIVELDPYGRKWPPTADAVEIGHSGKRRIHEEIYEMDAGEVAIEMSGVGNGRRRSRGGRPMSFVEGDDYDTSPMEVLSPSSARFGYGREPISPVSRTMSPISPASPAFPR